MRNRDLGLLIGEFCTLRLGFADPWFLSNEKSDWKLIKEVFYSRKEPMNKDRTAGKIAYISSFD